ncbi:hypothetical protein [Faecalimonas umbilicata]|uniref:hypothetical protein n=1 Tax=Faecalimonas umbilicata TaxID=1912855 RepID=UPI0022E2A663|nr:hypothetical protein [Faecalimonas umbilicata]
MVGLITFFYNESRGMGCCYKKAFCGRCPYVEEICKEKTPEMRGVQKGHRVACHLVGEK